MFVRKRNITTAKLVNLELGRAVIYRDRRVITELCIVKYAWFGLVLVTVVVKIHVLGDLCKTRRALEYLPSPILYVNNGVK